MGSDEDFFDNLEPEGIKVVPMECLGLHLDYSTVGFGTPVEALIVAKVMHKGEFSYRLISTRELNSVEAMGMFRWGQMLLEDGILNRCTDSEEEEEGEGDPA